ncbi:hypothetical protein O6P43_032405 [Quillaja saponaria]|uniref:Uncharacterized protein n=1 Tax=Quillaja saponaria TaxID=32244 RepID=A0AAD7P5L8_QUISA|nr:hypothetical protein O6P43_032405 [Quillaja saponaria]
MMVAQKPGRPRVIRENMGAKYTRKDMLNKGPSKFGSKLDILTDNISNLPIAHSNFDMLSFAAQGLSSSKIPVVDKSKHLKAKSTKIKNPSNQRPKSQSKPRSKIHADKKPSSSTKPSQISLNLDVPACFNFSDSNEIAKGHSEFLAFNEKWHATILPTVLTDITNVDPMSSNLPLPKPPDLDVAWDGGTNPRKKGLLSDCSDVELLYVDLMLEALPLAVVVMSEVAMENG